MFATRRSLLRMLEREREAHIAERARLIDVICNLAGKPWTPPPASPASDGWANLAEKARADRREYVERFTARPELLPD